MKRGLARVSDETDSDMQGLESVAARSSEPGSPRYRHQFDVSASWLGERQPPGTLSTPVWVGGSTQGGPGVRWSSDGGDVRISLRRRTSAYFWGAPRNAIPAAHLILLENQRSRRTPTNVLKDQNLQSADSITCRHRGWFQRQAC